MLKDFLKGIQIGLGILFIFGLFFGIVYAIGFHSADEITSGSFVGNFNFSGAIVTGLSANNNAILVDSILDCNSTNEGKLNLNSTVGTLKFCKDNIWKDINSFPTAQYSNCEDILTANPSSQDGIYWILSGNNVVITYCDMVNGGWTLIENYGTMKDQYPIPALNSKEELETSGWTFSTTAPYVYTYVDKFGFFGDSGNVGTMIKTLPSWGSNVKVHYSNAYSTGTVDLYVGGSLRSSKSGSQEGTEEYSYSSGQAIQLREDVGIIGIHELWVK